MKCKLLFVIAFSMLLCSCRVPMAVDEPVSATDTTLNYDNVKAMWISQYDLASIYTHGGKQREKEDFILCVEEMMSNLVSLGINTAIVQVRPFGDSMYPSEYYPVSSFVTGEYGIDADYDPFEIIVQEAHKRDISIHAWINPLRAMTDEEIKKVPANFKIRAWYDDSETRGNYISCVSGRWYLNPAYKEVRRLICDGVREIVEKYNVDGIHMDDYFYPTTSESFDKSAYLSYKTQGGAEDIAQFRRNNINDLVREIYSTVKSEKTDILFGISPSGNMKNNYNQLYADVATWCSSGGYIDYICPQVYFGFEHSTCDFISVCREFQDMIKLDNIKLIVGMTLGKAVSGIDEYAGEGKHEWRDNKDILKREIEFTMTLSRCAGVSYFCYQYFFDSKARAELENLLPTLNTAEWQ